MHRRQLIKSPSGRCSKRYLSRRSRFAEIVLTSLAVGEWDDKELAVKLVSHFARRVEASDADPDACYAVLESCVRLGVGSCEVDVEPFA